MTSTLRTTHLVVGAITVVAFLIAGRLMSLHEPPVAAMEWGDRLLFFAFFAEPMAGRPPGLVSSLGLFALFGGVLLYTIVNLMGSKGGPA